MSRAHHGSDTLRHAAAADCECNESAGDSGWGGNTEEEKGRKRRPTGRRDRLVHRGGKALAHVCNGGRARPRGELGWRALQSGRWWRRRGEGAVPLSIDEENVERGRGRRGSGNAILLEKRRVVRRSGKKKRERRAPRRGHTRCGRQTETATHK